MKLMKGFVMLTLGLVLTIYHVQTGLAQGMITFKPDKPVICYYSNENRPDHVEVSDHFKKWRQNATGRTKTAVFEVEYINFPPDNLAKTAFQYAIKIWESELTSTTPIRIRAEWMSLENGVLGQAIWGRAYANFGGEQHMNTFYPVALAEKIARKELNEVGEPDIVASFSSNTSWYYGTDGNTPSGKMDLVTIVLHEIAHGLGFSDTYDVEEGEGSVGLPSGQVSVPFIFDLFVENDSKENLFQDFISPSTELGAQLQNTNLFFNSPLSAVALGGIRPKLFAPSTFDGGSSISHLDEATFNAPGDANRLMTPHIAFAESIHDPGSVLIAMLSDIGWVHTNIEHVPLKDNERKDGQPYIVTASIQSDNGYDPNQVNLHYTTDGTNFTIVNMTPTGVPDQFESSLPGTTTDLGYAYFISVVDQENRIFTNPGKIEEQGKDPEQGTYFFNIGPDLATPEIIHEPVAYIFEGDSSLELTVEVTDNLGVKEVVVEYFFNAGTVQTAVMQERIGTDEFTTTITLPVLTIDDQMEYRFVARDKATVENISTLPAEGYYVVFVTGILPVQTSYVNDFDLPSNDFFGNSFSITTPPQFNNGAIHTTHPYPDGSGLNEESNYIYQLQIPILIDDSNPFIRFDEIVLVEPGESGAEFGGANFFDYVIVEGSLDRGTSWQPFINGYDASADSAWLLHYNNNMNNDNSVAEGDPGLYRERTINMVQNGNFSEGDEVLIRFRLFADALAHGWGWAIDNLSVQGPVTDVEQPLATGFKVYPVPVKQNLFVQFLNPGNEQINIQISDLQGRVIYSEKVTATSGMAQKNIDVQSFKDGFYILKAKLKDKMYTRKFLKVMR
jgi:hypothetical protein